MSTFSSVKFFVKCSDFARISDLGRTDGKEILACLRQRSLRHGTAAEAFIANATRSFGNC